MKKIVIYIHGKNGTAEESEHYKLLFPEDEVVGFDYESQTPWEAMTEFSYYIDKIRENYSPIVLIANSIGAYFAMNSLSEKQIEKAYFISPIVNMEKLITDMMQWAGVTEHELEEKGFVETSFGETLSWDYLSWVRLHPVFWKCPTSILYGKSDSLQSFSTIEDFAKQIGADLTVMENGEHWFHTKEQMEFLDNWIESQKIISKQ